MLGRIGWESRGKVVAVGENATLRVGGEQSQAAQKQNHQYPAQDVVENLFDFLFFSNFVVKLKRLNVFCFLALATLVPFPNKKLKIYSA